MILSSPRMELYSFTAFFAYICLSLSIEENFFSWSVHNYPDPFSFDTYSECGRNNKSSICDPNIIIRKQDADRLDRLISSVYQETRCLCKSCIQNSHGYVIRVAIVPRIEPIYKYDANQSEATMKDAQMFAYILTKKWSMSGDCNASLLIIYSRYDGLLYTLTLPGARSVLDDETVKRITMNVRQLFDSESTVIHGLEEMITRYKLVFDGQKSAALRPKAAKQRGNGATHVSLSIGFLLLTSFACLLSR